MPLATPSTILDPLWQGTLTPIDFAPHGGGPGTDVAKDEAEARPYLEAVRERPPLVRIGRPLVAPLVEVVSSSQLNPLLRASTHTRGPHDLYLARFSFGLLPPRRAVRFLEGIWWRNHVFSSAEFTVELFSEARDQVPMVYDLYPTRVEREQPHPVRVRIAPALRFHEIEAGLGAVDFTFEIPPSKPLITGVGAGMSTAMWSFGPSDAGGLQGDHWVYLLIGAPQGMATAYARLSLVATLGIKAPIPSITLKPALKDDGLVVALW
jgi:hypothetical protein